MIEEEKMEEEEAMMEEDNQASAGTYIEYTPASFASFSGEKRVLFFHAAWCPTCKSAERDILSRLDEIPAGVALIKIDYDKETIDLIFSFLSGGHV